MGYAICWQREEGDKCMQYLIISLLTLWATTLTSLSGVPFSLCSWRAFPRRTISKFCTRVSLRYHALPGKAPEHSEESAGWRSSNRGRNMLGFNAGPFKLFIVVSRGEAACKFPSMVLQRNAGARNRHVSASWDFFQHIQHLTSRPHWGFQRTHTPLRTCSVEEGSRRVVRAKTATDRDIRARRDSLAWERQSPRD